MIAFAENTPQEKVRKECAEAVARLKMDGWKVEKMEAHYDKCFPDRFLCYWITLVKNKIAIYMEVGDIAYMLPEYESEAENEG